MIPTTVLEGIIGAINKALETDPATLAKIGELAGTIYRIECVVPPITCSFSLEKQGLQLVDNQQSPDICLRGTATALVRLVISSADPNGSANTQGVELSGDAGALLQLSRALANLEIDWEELLSRLIGDVPARAVTELSTQAKIYQAQFAKTQQQNLRAFAHRRMSLISRSELDAVAQRTRELQYRLDRFEARLTLASRGSPRVH